jgi:outer membrane protein TolC
MSPAARSLSVIALLAALVTPLRAQDPPPADEPTAAGAASEIDQDTRPVLELSLDETVERALKNNTDIAVQKFAPEVAEADVTAARGAYDPLLSADFTRRSATTQGDSTISGGAELETDSRSFGFGLAQLLRSGASLRVDFDSVRSETNRTNALFNPSYNAALNAALTQPLLRNFRIDASRQRLRVAKNNRAISDAQFRQTVTTTLANVKQLYNNLLFSIDNLGAQRKNLALAKKLLEENRIRVRVGTLAPLDVVAAESEVASREEAVLLAENNLRDAEDQLKQAIFPENDPKHWGLRIVPTDRPTAERPSIDVESAVTNALAKRTDMAQARLGLENQDLGARLAREQSRPAVDLVLTYGLSGLSGTQRLDAFGVPLNPPIEAGLGDALASITGRDFPTWTIGFNVSYPLWNRAAKGAEARARLSQEQARVNLRRLELQVAAEVRSAARSVETNFKRVESTRAARRLAEQRLEAEEKRFAAGMSTNFLVTQAQRDLAVAEVSEVRAIADYRNSLIAFDRVQEAGLGGGGFVQ